MSPVRKPYKTGRRATVMAAPVTVSADWEPPVYDKTSNEVTQIKRSVARNFLFQHLADKDLHIIIQAMKLVSFDAGENIINQGEGRQAPHMSMTPPYHVLSKRSNGRSRCTYM
jgi:hypothetical protein